MSDMIDKAFSQTRGEIMHEFSLIKYDVRSALAYFLESQPDRPLNKFKKQLGRYFNSLEHREIQREFRRFLNSPASRLIHLTSRPKLNPKKLNPKVLENPEVQQMDAELLVAGDRRSFENTLKRLLEAAEKANFSNKLRSLIGEIEKAARERNLLTHSVWIDEQEKIVMLNYSDYHESKWMLIDENGKRKTPQASPRRTLEELQTFAAHLHDLSERLRKLFSRRLNCRTFTRKASRTLKVGGLRHNPFTVSAQLP